MDTRQEVASEWITEIRRRLRERDYSDLEDYDPHLEDQLDPEVRAIIQRQLAKQSGEREAVGPSRFDARKDLH